MNPHEVSIDKKVEPYEVKTRDQSHKKKLAELLAVKFKRPT